MFKIKYLFPIIGPRDEIVGSRASVSMNVYQTIALASYFAAQANEAEVASEVIHAPTGRNVYELLDFIPERHVRQFDDVYGDEIPV
jgi:hypothetical protein